jgi:hypothetical protein
MSLHMQKLDREVSSQIEYGHSKHISQQGVQIRQLSSHIDLIPAQYANVYRQIDKRSDQFICMHCKL